MGQVKLQAYVDGRTDIVTLSDVYYAKDLTHNLLSYCKLEEKVVALSYDDGRRYLRRNSDGAECLRLKKKTTCWWCVRKV